MLTAINKFHHSDDPAVQELQRQVASLAPQNSPSVKWKRTPAGMSATAQIAPAAASGWVLYLATLIIVPAARTDLPGATVLADPTDTTQSLQIDLEAETAAWSDNLPAIPQDPRAWRIALADLTGTLLMPRI